MLTKVFRLVTLLLLTLYSTLHVRAQTTEFGYQGYLTDGGTGANGLFDMSFGLFTTDTGGDAVATVTNTSVSVSNGLFTTTLDFGAAVFDGTDYWLEIAVQPDDEGGFTTLSPRQALTSAPYAIRAASVPDSGLSGNVALLDSNPTFTGEVIATAFTGDGSGLTHISRLDAADGIPAGALMVDNEGRVGIGLAAPSVPLQVTGGSDATRSGGGYVVVGQTNGANVAIDDNEIIGRNNGTSATLYLQSDGGTVLVGRNNGADLLVQGEATVHQLVLSNSPGANLKAGSIRWTGSDFEGYNGSQWVSLTMPVPQPVIHPMANMVWLGPGTFTMGSPDSEVPREPDEGPQTTVTISRGFWIGIYEVTQKAYEDVMGSNPSEFTGDLNRPVERVFWSDATNYCGNLTSRERSAGRIPSGYVYRLPTEAEWEYACRAGTTTRFSYGDDPGYELLGDFGWDPSNSGGSTQRVGQKRPNPWGLYDMHGNVWEWCQDWHGAYPGGVVSDPTGPASGSIRIFRGGSWSLGGSHCRSANRNGIDPKYFDRSIGFRVVLAPVL